MRLVYLRRRMAASLRTTLTIAFFAVSMVVLFISSGLHIVLNIEAQREIVSRKQQLIAEDAAQHVAAFVEDKFTRLATTVQLVDLVTTTSANQHQVLESLLGTDLAFRQVIVLNAYGQKVGYSTRRSQLDRQVLAPERTGIILEQIGEKNRYVSPIYIDPESSEPLILLAVPAANAFGDVQGALVAEVNLKFMWDLVDQIKVGMTGRAYVVDRQGRLIAFSDTARVLAGEDVSSIQAVHTFMHSESRTSATEVRSYPGIMGESVVGTYVALNTPDWAVVTELPWGEAYRAVIWQAVVALSITLAMVALASLLGVFLAYQLALPLVNLTATASRIAGGELMAQADVANIREIASLASTFNSMTAQLRHTLGDFEQRTIELQYALDQQTRLLVENQQQREVIREMSVPVLPLSNRTLIMPLIGAIDSARLRQVQQQALERIEQADANQLILDITGVMVVDTQVAQGLIQVAQAARLLGAQVILVGIRPEVAQTMVGLGINLNAITTCRSLQEGIAAALRG